MDFGKFLAHITEDGRTQTVAEHLINTANLSKGFARSFSAEAQAELAGLAHDIGKYSAAFQQRLHGSFIQVDHATAGAAECWQRRQPFAAFAVAIKNVQGAQSSGAALVSFNAPAFCSYGKAQNYNVPTSKYAAFAYTTVLNHLLADREHVYRMGDTTVVCWAMCGGDVYQNIFGAMFFGHDSVYTLTDLQSALKNLCGGNTAELDDARLDPNMDFFILGLAPNSAHLSVRFFLHNTFGNFLKNAQAHQQRLEIVKPAYDKFDTIPLWKPLDETVN